LARRGLELDHQVGGDSAAVFDFDALGLSPLAGELKPGARLPAERDLARDLGVAYDTVRRATALLRERSLIVTVHGRGTYVA
jgi:DNA-binding FadR family transcriptional regulator